ncbi:ABC transporter ATP-binding protein [Thermoanaerobacter mathranii]|uniref:ABC transporter ATP-binding protein n=1 Tax=Thermoanaerobacter mathranii TaxID=583357 RepID=UPI003D6B37BC
MEVLSVENLTKKYGKKVVLRNISVKVSKGEIVGLVGPNGAGKTTFIKCITGLLRPEEGSIKLFGYDLFQNYGKVIKDIGLLLEPAFYDYLTALENLKILMIASNNYNLKKIQEVMEFVGLWEVRNKYVTTFSFGMKQRLGLAQALMSDPQFLILDEPTIGLDPIGVNELKEKLVYLSKNKGVSILFSSHQLPDVEEICDKVILLREGVVLYDGVPKEAVKQKEYYIILSNKKFDKNTFEHEIMNNYLDLRDNVLIVRKQEILNNILKKLYDQNIDILDIDIKKAGLLELFYIEGQ